MIDNSKFEVSYRSVNDITLVDIKGFLDAHTAPMFEDSIKNIINDGNYRIIVNFKCLDYISSAGLGVLMAFIEDLRAKKGDIKLSEMSEKVFSVFDLLGFPMLFDIDNDENVSINKFLNPLINE